MSVPVFAGPLAAALATVHADAARAIAADLPGDVMLAVTDNGIVLSGHALSIRAAGDARLRDFAAVVRAAR